MKPCAVIADKKGRISISTALEAVGMSGDDYFRLNRKDMVRLPAGSRIFSLPERPPVAFDPKSGKFTDISDARSVAAFTPPGYTITHNAAYIETYLRKPPAPLPLFSYAACAAIGGDIYISAVMVDRDRRHDTCNKDMSLIKRNARILKKEMPANRLTGHLMACAVEHGCPNAQNLFLGRYEAPLPTSPECNASCAGCISRQKGQIAASQPRIKFIPSPSEISEIALYHIAGADNPIVSFGQGCEGEPLLCWRVIEESIKKIRAVTSKGVININTNGSMPDKLAVLFDAGLDSARISINSARQDYYDRYYAPQGYSFADVVRSMKISARMGYASVNYLTMPGFTDSADEFEAMRSLVNDTGIHMIQWRNLNYDPKLYFKKISFKYSGGAIGLREAMRRMSSAFPALRMGYFNPYVIPLLAASRRR